MAEALILLADGIEEMETVIIVDVLRRAAWNVTMASIDNSEITASRGVRLLADKTFDAIDPTDYDVLLIPGGMGGTQRLQKHQGVLEAIRTFSDHAKWIGAICAGPLVLQSAGILEEKLVTCHPGVRDQLTAPRESNSRVVVDGRIVTSQGPGTAFEFALRFIELIDSPKAMQAVADGLVLA
ncbi:MAG: DJ-1/PfpI family protein [Kiritimatiellae bacterium]|nr:DJ-1/PfpI family protein [Kiritimatiellia bacterium]